MGTTLTGVVLVPDTALQLPDARIVLARIDQLQRRFPAPFAVVGHGARVRNVT